MLLMDQIRVLLVLGPIALLLTLGFALTLRSGVVNLASGPGLRRAAGNLSTTVLLVLLCLALLIMLQQCVGFKLGMF